MACYYGYMANSDCQPVPTNNMRAYRPGFAHLCQVTPQYQRDEHQYQLQAQAQQTPRQELQSGPPFEPISLYRFNERGPGQSAAHLYPQELSFHSNGALVEPAFALPTVPTNLTPTEVNLPTRLEPTHVHSEIQVQVQEPEVDPPRSLDRGGTYTCTYHNCTLRFETRSELQQHKREKHRQINTAGRLITWGNSQTGPHKCERINPSTGKPCNSVFSRPYDLTRHEGTIHNANKEKQRCVLCIEQKTFSRRDALSRHMRLLHPQEDWPRK